MTSTVRVGYGLGITMATEGPKLAEIVDNLERNGFDSLWLPERVGAPAPDPLVALSFAAGRTTRLKLGTAIQVLPGRNPVLLAKAWASLDSLSGGRALPAFGLGGAGSFEQAALGVLREERSSWFDEAATLMRRLWDDDSVTHHGDRFVIDRFRPLVRPAHHLDMWFGGKAASELRRIGRLGDGWLMSFETPASAAAGREIIEETAAATGRTIDPGHYGTTLLYGRGFVPEGALAYARLRNPAVDPYDLLVADMGALTDRIGAFVAAGVSKFVLVPMAEPDDWASELSDVAEVVGSLET